MINIFIEEEYKDKVNFNNFTVNDDNILCDTLTNLPIDFNSYSVKQILSENNIKFYAVAYCVDTKQYDDEFTYIISRNENFYVHNPNPDINSDGYFYCEDCGNWYDDTYETYETQSGDYICERCRDNSYCECDCCHEIIHENDYHYCDECDRIYCDSCWDEHFHEDNLLYDYHEFDDWRLHKTDDEPEPEFYIGHELEIDDGDDMESAVDVITSKCNGICMHDGSLSSRGIEFISHPLSYKYMVSQEQNYRDCFSHLINLGYKSHNTSTCGLHFHVTRPTDSKIIDRIILFMETYKEEIIMLSRRKTDELNRWSRFLSDKRTTTNSKVIKSLDYIINNKDTSDRYMALNLTNSHTIEFRFFKGTLKYETFMADFEFINNLVHFASDLSIPVEELTWRKITSQGQFLPQYIQEHHIFSDKPIIDYSKETIIEFNEEKAQVRIEVDNLIGELLKTISNKARQKNNTSEKLRTTTNCIYKMNEQLVQLQTMVYELENLSLFNYRKLDNIKSDLRYVKERLGK